MEKEAVRNANVAKDGVIDILVEVIVLLMLFLSPFLKFFILIKIIYKELEWALISPPFSEE